jgi:hypothetical protein
MRLHFYKTKGQTASLNWPLLLGFVVMVPVVVVGLVELFWYKFTGGFSPLMGGFAFVAAVFILVRVIGASVIRQSRISESTASP